MKFTRLTLLTIYGVCWAASAWAVDPPAELSVIADATDSTVTLDWPDVADATGYNIYRDNAYLATVKAPSTMYLDLQPGSTYYITSINASVTPKEYSSKGPVVMAMLPGGSGGNAGCDSLPSHAQIRQALQASVAATGGPMNGGFDLNMWASVVDRDGRVCVVARTGDHRGDQWPGSRVISAQKANTANAFSLPGLALSTANIWAAVQPGGSLFGLQLSNPVDTSVAYGAASHSGGSGMNYGAANDPMVGEFIGGINVFGGGLALYNAEGTLLGGIGVSGDTSCADHNIAWRTRNALQLDYVPGGVGVLQRPDNINYVGDASNSALQNDFSHPVCAIAGTDNVSAVSAALPVVRIVP